MTRKRTLTLLLLALLLGFDPVTSRAGIIYNLVDYPAYQNGYHISGTITTDGTLGTVQTSNIVSWKFTISSASFTPIVTVTSSGPESASFSSGITATATAITMSNVTESTIILLNNIGTAEYYLETRQGNTVGSVGDVGTLYWQVQQPYSNPNITFATTTAVPEPSSIVLVGIASVTAGAVGCWKRRKKPVATP